MLHFNKYWGHTLFLVSAFSSTDFIYSILVPSATLFFSACYLRLCECHTNIHELLRATLQKVSWQYVPFPLLPLITHLFTIFRVFSVHFSLVPLPVMLLLCTHVRKGWLCSPSLALTWNNPPQSMSACCALANQRAKSTEQHLSEPYNKRSTAEIPEL